MKKIIILILILAVIALCFPIASASTISGIPAIKKIDYVSQRLKNGNELIFKRDNTIPLVQFFFYYKINSLYDPMGKGAFTEIMSSNLIRGGSDELTPVEIDDKLKLLGANYSSSINDEYGYLSLSVLSKNAVETLKIFLRALYYPRFDKNEFEIIKKIEIENMANQKLLPKVVLAESFYKGIYGKNTPYSNFASTSGMKKIKRSEILDFYNKHFGSDSLIVAVSGDISLDSVVNELELFNIRSREPLPPILPVNKNFHDETIRIEKGLITNSFIKLGHIGIKRDNTDKFKINVMNYILGAGGFNSILMKKIREEMGLVYYIFSSYRPLNYDGVFSVSAETQFKNEQNLISIIKEELTNFSKGLDITASAVESAKKSLLYQQLFWLENSYSIVSRIAEYKVLGYPEDYWKIYRENIAKVDKIDIERVAGEYIKPNDLVTVIVGPKE